MDEKRGKGDTTKILPPRLLHIIVIPGPWLVCRHCGTKEGVEMPLLVGQALQVFRDFRDRHARCPGPPEGR